VGSDLRQRRRIVRNALGWSGTWLFFCRLLAFSSFLFWCFFSFVKQGVVPDWFLGVAVFICGAAMFLSMPFEVSFALEESDKNHG